jgi:hypothetical protein
VGSFLDVTDGVGSSRIRPLTLTATGSTLTAPFRQSRFVVRVDGMTTPHEATTTAPPTHEPRRGLLELIWGYRVTQVLYAAASLGIAEALRSGPCGARDLAAAVGAHEPSLVRLLKALISLGLLKRGSDERYDLTDTGRLLDGESPGSMRAFILYDGSKVYENWRELVDSVRTGQNVYQRRYGIDMWTYHRTTDREEEKLFNSAMQDGSASRVGAVVDAYDFSGLGTIIDVGGGRGSLLAGVLKAYPAARGVLFDQPAVVAGAPAVLSAAGVMERCRVSTGSFFEGVPPDGDVYILSRIIHDWDDEPASVILGNCRRAMPTSSRLLLIERVLPDQPGGDVSSYLGDLNMLHSVSGRERSEAEFRTLLARSGLRLARVVATQSPFAVLEGWPLV